MYSKIVVTVVNLIHMMINSNTKTFNCSFPQFIKKSNLHTDHMSTFNLQNLKISYYGIFFDLLVFFGIGICIVKTKGRHWHCNLGKSSRKFYRIILQKL